MKTHHRFLLLAASLVPVFGVSRAAETAPAAPKEEKRPLRVLAAPARENRLLAQRDPERREKREMETVAFLGVETGPVSPTISAQLGLPRGTGLVVNHVLPKSAADGVLNEHDILLKLDDQILIETRQLSVLIRTHKEGDSITLTYLRGGQKATATVKLGQKEVPKMASVPGVAPAPFAAAGAGRFEYVAPEPDADGERVELDRVLSMIQRVPSGETMRIQVDRNAGPGFRAMRLHTGNSTMVFSDDNGSLELTSRDGAKTLVAKDAKGAEQFSGPVTTPEERKALPPEVRERLERLEGMHDITFHTDGDFQGADIRVANPRGIVLPLPSREAFRASSPLFY